MFNVYMRPWVLRKTDEDPSIVPHLANLSSSHLRTANESSLDKTVCSENSNASPLTETLVAAPAAHGSPEESYAAPAAHVPPQAESEDNAEAQTAPNAATAEQPTKRRRLRGKQPPANDVERKDALAANGNSRTRSRSHAESWQWYIRGNVVSDTSARFIRNMWSHCAATCMREETGDKDESEPESDTELYKTHAGNMELVRRTLEGIAEHDTDEHAQAFGRHAQTIQLGKALWATPHLKEEEARGAQEEDFDSGQFPSVQEAKKAAQAATKEDVERPKPYAGATEPSVDLFRYPQRSRLGA